MRFEIFLHMNFGLPGPLRTAFELKLPTSIFTPDAATLTLHALKLQRKPNTSKYVFEKFPNSPKFKISKSGMLTSRCWRGSERQFSHKGSLNIFEIRSFWCSCIVYVWRHLPSYKNVRQGWIATEVWTKTPTKPNHRETDQSYSTINLRDKIDKMENTSKILNSLSSHIAWEPSANSLCLSMCLNRFTYMLLCSQYGCHWFVHAFKQIIICFNNLYTCSYWFITSVMD